MAKKPKVVMPTVEEFLQFRPVRQQYEWSEDNQGHVCIKVPKFTSKIGKSLCKLMRKNQIFDANMDEVGSIVWKMSTGKHTVQDILKELEKHNKDEKELDQRLFLFLQQMKGLNYIEF